MADLSLVEIARAVKGELAMEPTLEEAGKDARVAGYSIDSRTTRPGDLFFAIVGPRHDGHRFVGEALARGAAAAVVARGLSGDRGTAPALVRVEDTTRALQDLGAHVRRARRMKVIGITGSAGKTTAKEMTAAVLGERFSTYRSEGNLNNTYGLPLALLRMPDDRDVAVLEMGMSTSGEIARLVEIADPDVGVLLNVLRVHLEHFESFDAIVAAKWELFRDMRRDATAIYNADDPPTDRLGRAFPGRTIPYGLENRGVEVAAESIVIEDLSGTRFVLRLGTDRAPVNLPLPGRHNIHNALAAAAAGFSLGIDAPAVARGLNAVRPAPMRGVLHVLPNGVHLLDDSYNSNPSAMDRAMEMLSDASPEGRRILVAGDMLELGPYERRAHTRIGELVAAAGIDLFVAVGALSERAVTAARASGSTTVHHFATSEEAAPFVVSEARRGDLVLVKGSRGMKMERVVEALISAGGRGVEEIH